MADVKLTKADLRKNFFRINLLPMCTINYERFQALQYCHAMIPIIRRLYPDNREERIKAAQRHMEFYNTTPVMINFTMGLSVAQEEKAAAMEPSEERDILINSINAMKTSLMGPLAGVGDSFKATVNAILGSIAAGFALNGSILGAFIFLIGHNAIHFGLAYYAYKYSYMNGTKAITDFNKSGILQRVMDSANILGLMSLGCLIPSWIGFNLNKDFVINEVTINLQNELNNIFPGLVPLALTLILARLYKKKVSALQLVGIIFLAAAVMSFLGFNR